MYLFKTSGNTYNSVIANEKHAFLVMPQDWTPGELILVSKNKNDCGTTEKQIQHIMHFVDIRPIRNDEIEQYWPGNSGRWKYLVICENTKCIKQPFNLVDIIGADYEEYKTVMTFKKLHAEHEKIVSSYLQRFGVL